MNYNDLFNYRDEFGDCSELLDDELGENFKWDHEYNDWLYFKNEYGEEGLFESEKGWMEESWDREIKSVEESLEELIEKEVVEEEPAKEIDLTSQISLIEEQRVIKVRLLRRKKINMQMMVKLYQFGLCETEVPDVPGTVDEVQRTYNGLLLKFKDYKTELLKQKQILDEKKRTELKALAIIRNECDAIIDAQTEQELKLVVGTMNKRTRQTLTYDLVLKWIKDLQSQIKRMHKRYPKYLVERNELKKLEKDYQKLKRTRAGHSEIFVLFNQNRILQDLIKYKLDKIENYRTMILDDLKNTKNISKKNIDIKDNVETNEFSWFLDTDVVHTQLEQIVKEWRRNVMIRKHNRMVLNRRKEACPKDVFDGNPLMQDDYQKSKETALKIEERIVKLQQQSDQLQTVIKNLKMQIHTEIEKRKRRIKRE